MSEREQLDKHFIPLKLQKTVPDVMLGVIVPGGAELNELGPISRRKVLLRFPVERLHNEINIVF